MLHLPGITLRPVQDSDLSQVVNLDRLSFAPLRSSEEIANDWYGGTLNLPDHALFLAVEDATNRGIATYAQIALGLHFQQAILPTMGIAGVAVAPHRRGQQIARMLLHHALEDARSQQIPLVMLYPFQQGFYRRLGWAWVGRSQQYRISTHHLPLYRERKDIFPYDPDRQESAIKAIYQTASQRYNGWLRRKDWHWKKRLKPATGQEIYCYGDDGGFSGYVILEFANINPPQNVLAIVVQEWVALTVEAYRGILGFLAALRDQVSTVVWNTHTDDPFPHLLQEQRCDPTLVDAPFEFGLSHRLGEMGAGFMWRLVDLEQAFRLRPIRTIEPFTLTFEVFDPVFEESAIAIEFVNGQMHPTTQRTSTRIRTSIEHLTVLFSGIRQASSLLWTREIEVEGDDRLLLQLDKAWQATPPFCWDFF
jgi:predicted acetyltransferase